MELNIVRSGEFGTDTERWTIQHRDRALIHNHMPSNHPTAHPVHRRAERSVLVREAIATDAEIGTRAAQTMARLTLLQPGIAVVRRDIYNERQRVVNERAGGLTRMEFLLRQPQEGDYFVQFRTDEEQRFTHLFFAFGPGIEVFKENYDIILLDCTYKTNRFGMPLLNIVGVSSTNATVHIAQAFIKTEQQPDYEWAIEQLLLMMTENCIPNPQVVFSDADLALINALERQLPSVPHLLCLWHVIKNIETHARTHTFRQIRDDAASTSNAVKWKDSEQHRNFCDAFLRVIYSTTESEYEFRLRELHMLSSAEARYIDDVWLSLWKRRLVRCWTDGVVHFGLQATSRVEGYHATMKTWLATSRGDLLTIQTRLRHWWMQSVDRYWATKANEQIKLMNRLRGPLYDAVVKVISSYALVQTDRVRLSTELLIRPCTGAYNRSFGLLCSHQIHAAVVNGRGLKPDQFHAHWWIDRRVAPVPPPARILEPETISDRRAQRRIERRQQRRGGSGRWGTRRLTSQFELSQTFSSM